MPMAASLSSPSVSSPRLSCFFRRNPAYLNIHIHHYQRGIVSFADNFPCQKCIIKCNKVHYGALSGSRLNRLLAAAGALEVDGENEAAARRLANVSDASLNCLDSINILESQLDNLFREVKTLLRLGKENEAIDLLQANYEAVKEQLDAGARGIEEAAILNVIALGYMALGDKAGVGSMLNMLNTVVAGLKENEPLLDSILIHMGNMYEKLENFEMAINLYRKAISVTERKYGDTSCFLKTPLLGMAKVLGSIGKATEAIDAYQRVITILELSKGTESEELVLPLFAIGNLLLKEGKIHESEDLFNRILNMYKKLYGEKDGRVGMVMCSLARVKCGKGSLDEAINLYDKALETFKNSNFMALDDEVMEKVRIELAELLHMAGRSKEGRALIEECLLITEKHKGKDHESCVTHLVNLATSYSRSKNFIESERLLRRSLQIMMKKVPPDDPSITYPMLHLAVTLYNLNRDKEAESLALEVLRSREITFGKESPLVGEALDCLVSIQTRLGEDDKAILVLLKRVLKIQERTFGHESEEVVETLKKTIHCLDKLGMRIEKLPLERRLSYLRKKYKDMIAC